MLVLVAIGRLMEDEWDALEEQERFSYNYNERKIMVSLVDLPSVRCRASSFKLCIAAQLEVLQMYLEKSANCGMF